MTGAWRRIAAVGKTDDYKFFSDVRGITVIFSILRPERFRPATLTARGPSQTPAGPKAGESKTFLLSGTIFPA